jgi:Fibronectin-attachment protein (FAP)
MHQVDPNSTRRKGLLASLAIAAAAVVTITFPATSGADPEPVPAPSPAAPSPTPASPAPASPAQVPGASPTPATPPPGASPTPNAQPGDPAAPQPVDPNAPVPPDPNAAEVGRVTNAVGGFSFVVPPGWVESDASHLDYGSALLSKAAGEAPAPGQAPAVANDTRIVLGRLDQKLYASAEATNPKAAVRLGSDMGEFFMPYPGTRLNQETVPLNANGVSGSASYYEVKFSDPSKPTGQIWTGVVGTPAGTTPTTGPPQRWFVVWLGTSNNPVDKNAAKILAESIRPATAPAAPATEPVPGATAPAPGAPAPEAGAPAPAPAPAQAPAAGAPAPAQAPAAGAPAAGGPSPTPAPAPAPAAPAQAPAGGSLAVTQPRNEPA